MLSPLKNIFRKDSMSSQLIPDNKDGDVPEVDNAQVWTVQSEDPNFSTWESESENGQWTKHQNYVRRNSSGPWTSMQCDPETNSSIGPWVSMQCDQEINSTRSFDPEREKLKTTVHNSESHKREGGRTLSREGQDRRLSKEGQNRRLSKEGQDRKLSKDGQNRRLSKEGQDRRLSKEECQTSPSRPVRYSEHADAARPNNILHDGEKNSQIKEKLQRMIVSNEDKRKVSVETNANIRDTGSVAEPEESTRIPAIKQQGKWTKRKKTKNEDFYVGDPDTSSDSDGERHIVPDDNWRLKSRKKAPSQEYLRITIDDLQKLIQDKVASAVSTLPQPTAVEMKAVTSWDASRERDNTDSEMGFSFSSGNSTEALLADSRPSRRATLHLVNPARRGILRRFLPLTEDDSINSISTQDTMLPPERVERRRRSLQPDDLQSFQHRTSSHDLLQQSSILRGGHPRLSNADLNRVPRYKPYHHLSQRYPKVSFLPDHDDYFDDCSLDEDMFADCRPSYPSPPRRHNCRCNAEFYQMESPYKALKSNSFKSERKMLPSPLYSTNLPLPQVMVSPPSHASNNEEPSKEEEIQKVIVEQLKDVFQESQNSYDITEDSPETNKKEDNPFARIQARLAEKKKKDKENGPIRTARIISATLGLLMLVCAGSVVAVGVYNIISDVVTVFTGVLEPEASDMAFHAFCIALLLLGSGALCAWICLCCSVVRIDKCCIKTSIVAVLLLIILQCISLAALFTLQNDVISIPLLAIIMSQVKEAMIVHLRQLVTQHYRPDSLFLKAWDKLQVAEQCCGLEGPTDFENSAWKNITVIKDPKRKIPDTCCKLKVMDAENPEPTNDLLCQTLTPGFSHQSGCLIPMKQWYDKTSIIALSAVTSLIVFEILCVICAVRYCKIFKQKQTAKNSPSRKIKQK